MWNEIKPGQVLLTKGRKVTIGRRVIFTEWEEHVVDSVSKVFYVVNGDKHRKDNHGKQPFLRFYFPGFDGAPEQGTDPGEYESLMSKVKAVVTLGTIIRPGLEDVLDIDKAAELAIKLKGVLGEIELQPKA